METTSYEIAESAPQASLAGGLEYEENRNQEDKNWGHELTAIVAANANKLVKVSWLGGATMSVSEAMSCYPYPPDLTAADEPFLIGVVWDLLANEVVEEPKVEEPQTETENDELENGEPQAEPSVKKLEVNKPQNQPEQPRPVEAKQPPATTAVASEVLESPTIEPVASKVVEPNVKATSNVKPASPAIEPILQMVNKLEVALPEVKTSPVELPAANQPTLSEINSSPEPPAEASTAKTATNPVAKIKPAAEDPVADLPLPVEFIVPPETYKAEPDINAELPHPEAVTVESHQPVRVVEAADTKVAADLVESTGFVINPEASAQIINEADRAVVLQAETDYLIPKAPETTDSVEEIITPVIIEHEPVAEPELPVFEPVVAEMADLPPVPGQTEPTEQARTIPPIYKGLEVPIEPESGIPEDQASLVDELLQNSLDLPPELVEQVAALRGWQVDSETEDLLKSIVEAAPQNSGTHEIISKIIVSVNSLKKAKARAGAIGKSALRLYIFNLQQAKYLTS